MCGAGILRPMGGRHEPPLRTVIGRVVRSWHSLATRKPTSNSTTDDDWLRAADHVTGDGVSHALTYFRMTQICIERERDKRKEKEKEKENKGDINTSIHTVRLYLWTYSPDLFEQNKIKSSFYTIIELHSASTYRKLQKADGVRPESRISVGGRGCIWALLV